MAQSSVDVAFTAYVRLTVDEKRQFDAMKTGYEYSRQTQVNAGKKSAATKKAKAATGGAEA